MSSTTATAPDVISYGHDDLFIDPQGQRYQGSAVIDDDGLDGSFILHPEGAQRWANPQHVRYLTFDEFDAHGWTHIPGEEVNSMYNQPTDKRGASTCVPPTPPKMTKAEWTRRERTTVTLTRGELEQLAQLVTAGHALLRDGRSVSPQLRAAMTRLGIATHGL